MLNPRASHLRPPDDDLKIESRPPLSNWLSCRDQLNFKPWMLTLKGGKGRGRYMHTEGIRGTYSHKARDAISGIVGIIDHQVRQRFFDLLCHSDDALSQLRHFPT